jgi:hypothetical protein
LEFLDLILVKRAEEGRSVEDVIGKFSEVGEVFVMWGDVVADSLNTA